MVAKKGRGIFSKKNVSQGIKQIRSSVDKTANAKTNLNKSTHSVMKSKELNSLKSPMNLKSKIKAGIQSLPKKIAAKKLPLKIESDEEEESDDGSDILADLEDDEDEEEGFSDEDEESEDDFLDSKAEEASDSEVEREDQLLVPEKVTAQQKKGNQDRKRPLLLDDSDDDDDDNDDEMASDDDEAVVYPSASVPVSRKRKIEDESDESDADVKIPVKNIETKSPVSNPPKKPFVTSDSKAPHQAYMQDTPVVADPILQKDIKEAIQFRLATTVRVRPLPANYRFAQVYELCPEAVAVRIPWNLGRNRSKGVAFIEFKDVENAKKWASIIEGKKFLGQKATCSILPDAANVDIREYNCSRVVVSSLHPHTTRQELKDLIPTVKAVDFLSGTRSQFSKAPAFAFLTFNTEQEALNAIQSFQGANIRGRRTSWMFQKRAEKMAEKVDRTELVVFGVSKKITNDDLQKAFPNSKRIEVRVKGGMAVVSYNNESDCNIDYQNCPGTTKKIGNATLRVFYGHNNFKDKESRVAEGDRRRELSAKKVQKNDNKKGNKVIAGKTNIQQTNSKPTTPKLGNKPVNAVHNKNQEFTSKSQLVIKDFDTKMTESDFSNFVGVQFKKILFTKEKRLAFMHFFSDADAATAKEKFKSKPLGSKQVGGVQFAYDKPDKKKTGPPPNKKGGTPYPQKSFQSKKNSSSVGLVRNPKQKTIFKAPLAINETLGDD